VEHEQRQLDQALATLLARGTVVDCRPPEAVSQYWSQIQESWGHHARAERNRIRAQHDEAVLKVREAYFSGQGSMTPAQFRQRLHELHERQDAALRAAETLGPKDAYAELVAEAAGLAQATLDSFWERTLADLRASYPLPDEEAQP
jgi:hypothetical protein